MEAISKPKETEKQESRQDTNVHQWFTQNNNKEIRLIDLKKKKKSWWRTNKVEFDQTKNKKM